MDLTYDEFREVCTIIYAASGIVLNQDKYDEIRRYVSRRIADTELPKSLYFHCLRQNDPADNEQNALLRLILNHETFFFRDYNQLSYFAEECLNEFKKRTRYSWKNHIKVWVAGCSTGEEAYTIAIILNVMLEDEAWNYEITATDIDSAALAFAQKGVYTNRSERSVPQEYLDTYFEKVGEAYHVHDALKNDVQFKHLNLIDDESMRTMTGFDFIFCKNVLFYFDKAIQKKVLENLFESLNPGGYLFVDYSTTIQNVLSHFRWKDMGKYFYQK